VSIGWPHGRRARVAAWLGCAAAALVVWVGLAGLAPSSDPASTVCLLRRTTGIDCPGCGMTRAFSSLARGDVGEAVAFHPLAPLVAGEVALAWGAWGLVLLGWVAPPAPDRVRELLLGNLGIMVAVWLGRMATGTLP
jgi:hypothetical protein